MSPEILAIAATAAFIGFTHTLMGPDHYLPFVMIGRARRWSHLKLAVITVICGIAHVLSSVALGLIGIAAGIALGSLESFEGVRGELASYLLIAFGLAYGIWGLRRGMQSKPHTHKHFHIDEHEHEHEHEHTHDHTHAEHKHLHEEEKDDSSKINVSVWAMFIIFLLGPCEPLIPLVMFPAAEHSIIGVVLVAGVFGVVTITTMTVIALALYSGIKIISTDWMERYIHAMAGFVIALSGSAIAFLGL